MPAKLHGEGLNPSGLCMCGCGERTQIAPRGNSRRGTIAGTPNRFVPGHQRRKSPHEFLVEDRGYDTPCWIWQRGKSNGYGIVGWSHRANQYAHRIYYERAKGAIPEGLCLDHLCRNPACVNPDHLEPVTPLENLRRGASMKLSDEDVREIRRRSAAGDRNVDIACDYRMDSGYICKVIKGRARSDVA